MNIHLQHFSCFPSDLSCLTWNKAVRKKWQVGIWGSGKKAETDTKCCCYSPRLMKYSPRDVPLNIIFITREEFHFLELKQNSKKCMPGKLSILFLRDYPWCSSLKLHVSFYYVTWSIQPLSLGKSFFMWSWVFLPHSTSDGAVDNMDSKS